MKLIALLALAFSSSALGQAPPTIGQIGAPTTVVPGSVIAITGMGLTGTTSVTIGTATDGTFVVVDNTSINFTVPVDAPPGGNLTVTTPQGSATFGLPVAVVKLSMPAPVCLPSLNNVNTLYNPSTGNTVASMWCDIPTGTYYYALAGNTTIGTFSKANCLAGVAPFSLTMVWMQQAWNACVNSMMNPSDQAYAQQLAYQFVPRPTIKGPGSMPVLTAHADGTVGAPLSIASVPQTIAGGGNANMLRLAGGFWPRYCDVSGLTSDQGNVLPAASYASCALAFPPAGGFLYLPSLDKATITAPTVYFLADAAHNLWGIDAKGIITVNNIEDPSSAMVVELAYVSGLIWQKNANNLWWSKSAPSAAWLPAGGTATAPL
jgi:hypothetical protein